MLRIRDVYPESRILIFTHPGSQIPDPKTATKERSEKRLVSYLLNYLSFEVLKRNIWANFQRIIELFTQKIVTKLSKIWSWQLGPGPEIWNPEKTYSGSRTRGQKVLKKEKPARY